MQKSHIPRRVSYNLRGSIYERPHHEEVELEDIGIQQQESDNDDDHDHRYSKSITGRGLHGMPQIDSQPYED